MATTNLRRAAAVLAAASTALAGLAVAPAAPARAVGGSPERYEQPSGYGTGSPKAATVGCPQPGQRVYAAGARVVGADGGVVLTGVVPDPTLTSVTATAAARTGYPHAWSLVVYAVCRDSAPYPYREPASAAGTDQVTATCPDPRHHLTGTGFRVQGSVDHSYVDEVSIGPGLRSVRVHAGGPGAPASVTAYAICKADTSHSTPPAVRVAETSDHDASWPKRAAAGDPGSPDLLYGVGGVVEGGGGRVFLSALVPDLDQDLARVEAVRVWPLPAAGLAAARVAADETDEEGSVTAYGILIGTFH